MPGRAAESAAHGRVAVLIDYRFRRAGVELTVERAFAVFLFALAGHVDKLVLVGRFDPAPQPFPYVVPRHIGFVGIPYYPSLSSPLRALGALLRGLRELWAAAGDADVLWVLGPNPAALLFAAIGLLRGRRVVLGVRQDMRAYVRSRHPGRRPFAAAADLMEVLYRVLARGCAVVVVGSDLAHRYRRARSLHLLHVSLVRAADVLADDPADRASFRGRLVSVGRLDTEKNPLLLADILAAVAGESPGSWRLDVFGEGPLEAALEARLAELGVSERAELHGYVAADDGLRAAYLEADAFLHVSWTEGMPQVLLEAFAARLPTVATDVGGVRGLAGDAALLVEPGDAGAAAAALRRLAGDPALRRRLADAGVAVAREHTIEAESARLATFLLGAAA